MQTTDELFDMYLRNIKVDRAVVDLSTVSFTKNQVPEIDNENIPTVTLSDDDLNESASLSIISNLSASRDVFTSAARYGFSIARFRLRGYDNLNEVTLVNGSPIKDLTSGLTMFNTWSGLNDETKNRESIIGLAPATFSYGGLAGSNNIDTRAARQRKQIQVSYAISNRAYDNRVMASYGSGVLKNGWSFALSYSRRWADEGYLPGTFYDGNSYFASAEKFINNKHSISLTMFGSATKNGRAAAVTQEMYDLANSHYYNPDWGYQDGKVRNAVVGNTHEPVIILTHEWKINSQSSVQSSASYLFGKSKVSGLDWYNAPDPQPDYYRNLPSFVLSNTGNPTLAAQTADLYSENESVRQINWDHLYDVNRNAGDTAKYVLADRVSDNKIFTFNTFYNNTINEYITVFGGFTYQTQTTEYYKQLTDLLGGQYFVNLNQFADQTVEGNNQFDLNNPNRRIYVGDKYDYDYVAHINYVSAWQQTALKFSKVDAFYAFKLSETEFYRDGKTRNGIFPDNSYGESVVQSFFNYSVKAGATYNIYGHNFIFFNGTMETRPPVFRNALLSPATQNTFVQGLGDEKVASMEYGYLYKSPRFKARAVGYMTEFNDGLDSYHFYDDDFKTYVNYSIAHVDKRNIGVELATEVALGNGVSVSAVAAMGQFFYTDKQKATITQDNKDTLLASNETVYATNLHVGGTPEDAYTVGVSYRSKHFWSIYLNANYFDNIYVRFNPARRTESGIDEVNENDPLRNEILSQQKLPGQFTLDASASWSWKINNRVKSLKKNTFLVFNAGLSNILNNTSFITSGSEQLRFDFQDKDVNKFAPKYFYAYGTTFFASVVLRMN